MYRQRVTPLLVAAFAGIISGVYTFKPMLDGSMTNGPLLGANPEKPSESEDHAQNMSVSSNIRRPYDPAHGQTELRPKQS